MDSTMERARPAVRELMTDADVISFLRLDTDGGNAVERLRNLIRRNGLPVIRRGRLRRFRRAAIDAWLAAGERPLKRKSRTAADG